MSGNQRRLPASLNPVKQESDLVPFSATNTVNRYAPLGSTVGSFRPNYQSAPSYQSALVTPFDPYTSNSRPSYSQPPYQYNPQSSSYMRKGPDEYLFTIPKSLSQESSPAKIVKQWFPPKYHYQPKHPSKTLQFYKEILERTESISFKPITDKSVPPKILYHSIYIGKFVTESEWGVPPYMSRPLPSESRETQEVFYDYFDYIDAWTNIFFHQTEEFSHSWFICFDKKFKLIFPAWFYKWWSVNGPTASYLPESLMQKVSHFQDRFDRSKIDPKVSLLSIFMAKYKVPWILKWHYEVKDNEILRVRLVKWWDKFSHQRIIDQVLAEFPVKQSQLASQPAQTQATLQLQPVKTPQSLSEISPSSSLKGKSKSKSSRSSNKKADHLADLAQKLLAQAAHLQSQDHSDAESEASDASTQQPVNPGSTSQSRYWADSQDPFEDIII